MIRGKDILRSIKNYFEMEKLGGIREYLFFKSEKKKDISSLKNEALSCRKCLLCQSRKNIVFGEGNVNARLVFVGEAPGYEEDLRGRPFVGEAGRLLTKIIEAMRLNREDVFICNILKCRPPKNRDPLPEEIDSCIEYLYEQLAYIKPEVICGLGKFASQTLLKTNTPITRLRGNWHNFKDIKFMPTYHPAYLLRNPKDKKLVWEDMKKIMDSLSL